MTWAATPEERRAYAIKKSKQRAAAARRERQEAAQPEPQRPVGDFSVHPSQHCCAPYDLSVKTWGYECGTCGRRWVMEQGHYDEGGVWKDGGRTQRFRILPLSFKRPPLTARCDDEGNRLVPLRSRQVEVPSGRLGEMPPDHVIGPDRGDWWKCYASAREALRSRTQSA